MTCHFTAGIRLTANFKYYLYICLAIIGSSRSFAQPGPLDSRPTSLIPVTRGLESIQASDLQAHLVFLASDIVGGRGTGEPGLQIAAEYLASHFRRLKLLSPVGTKDYFQNFELWRTRLDGGYQLALEKPINRSGNVREHFQPGVDFVLSARNLRGSREMTSAIVFVGYGITAPEYDYNDYDRVFVEGKIVMAVEGEPSDESNPDFFRGPQKTTRYSTLWKKTTTAAAAGALAMLVVQSSDDEKTFSQRAGGWGWQQTESMVLPGNENNSIPIILISRRVAERVLEPESASLAELLAQINLYQRPNSFEITRGTLYLKYTVSASSFVTQNVVALLEGTDPELRDEAVVYSAHYDHLGTAGTGEIFHGADDDGSGTVAIMEIAEAFVNNATRPKRSILFIGFAGEEKGLLGSNYYSSHPVINMDKTIAALNLDMVGRNDPDTVYIIGSNMLSLDVHNVNESAADLIPDLFLNYRFNDRDDPNRYYYRSDHYNFAKHNVPVIFYFSDIHQDYHKPTDTVDKINFGKIKKIAELAFLTGWTLANRYERPRLNGVLGEND